MSFSAIFRRTAAVQMCSLKTDRLSPPPPKLTRNTLQKKLSVVVVAVMVMTLMMELWTAQIYLVTSVWIEALW